jgi:DNA invertase Pin-like site-specific DNA recombinase
MEGKAMKSAILYTRVSTQRQVEEGVSLDAQYQKAEAWCRLNDYTLTEVFTDAGISGGKTRNRPGLRKALDYACKNKAALVVYSLSRLARSTRDALEISDRLSRCGADLVSLTEQIDTTTAAGRMIFGILAVFSEFERNLVSERTRSGLAYKKSRGEKLGGRYTPYGYDAREGKLVENKYEQSVVRTMRLRRKEGLSYQSIAQLLDTDDITAKAGGKWNAMSVRAAVNYKGVPK